MLVLLMIGCESGSVTIGSNALWNLFPFEQGRVWTYASTDPDVPHRLVVRRADEVEDDDGIEVYTLVYDTVCAEPCVGEERMRVQWSSVASEGVRIHSVSVDGHAQTFVPPLRIAGAYGVTGDTWVTETGGRQWMVTLHGLEDCQIDDRRLGECARFTLAHDGDDEPMLPLRTLLVAPGHGVVALRLADEPAAWRVSEMDCGACDGEW